MTIARQARSVATFCAVIDEPPVSAFGAPTDNSHVVDAEIMAPVTREAFRIRGSAHDLASIAEYIAHESGSRAVAERFTHDLRAKCHDLARVPIRMGRPRAELRGDLRSCPYKGYVIFFRYVGDVLEIVNVIEGYRDIATLFGEDER